MAPKVMKAKAMKAPAAKPAKTIVAAASKAKTTASKRSVASLAASKKSVASLARASRGKAAQKKPVLMSASKKRAKPKQEEPLQVDQSDSHDNAACELSPQLAAEVLPKMDVKGEDSEAMAEPLENNDGRDGDEPTAQKDETVVTPERSARKPADVKGETESEKVKVLKSRRMKKDKKPVDPNKPKRPAGGAFGSFMEEHRAEIAASVPAGSSVAAVSKAAGERWRAMDEDARKPYQEKYLLKAEAYTTAYEEYCVSIGIPPPKRAKVAGDEGEEGEAVAKPRDLGPVPEEDIDKAALREASGLGYETKFRTLIAMRQFRHLPHDKIVKALRCCGGRMSGNGRYPTAAEVIQRGL